MMDGSPSVIQVEVSSLCNLNCFMCQRRTWNPSEEGVMGFSLFKRLRDAVREADKVVLYGLGEPLMNPDIVKMAEFVKRESEADLTLTTNGTLLTRGLAGKLVSAGVTSIYVSLDSLNEERLRKIRYGIDSRAVLENLRYLAGKFSSDVEVGVEYVVMRGNLDELPSFVADVAEMGVEHVLVSHVVPYSEEAARQAAYTTISEEGINAGRNLFGKGWEVILEAAQSLLSMVYAGVPIKSDKAELLMDAWRKAREMNAEINAPLILSGEVDVNILEKVKRVFGEASKVASQYGLKLTLPPAVFSVNARKCPYVEKNATTIRWDGGVAPCQEYLHEHRCYVNKHYKKVIRCSFGNIKERSLEEIWNEEEYVEFRERTKNIVESTPWCGDCPYSTMDCWFTRSNELDCYGNTPSCSECIYSTGLAKCNI